MVTHAESRPESDFDRHTWPLYLLFLLSGGAGLVYQVMWARNFGLIFGSTTRAASVVLAAFFFGMAIGNLMGSRWSATRSGSLRAYGLLELAIAAGAVLVIFWLQLFHNAYPMLYRFAVDAPHMLIWIQLGLALFAMAPPCIAMGATLPLMSRAVLSEHGNMSSPTILFILDRLRRAAAEGPCVALGFGPGLVAEAALFDRT